MFRIKTCTGCYSVDETIAVEKKDTQKKPTDAVERLEATPGEQSTTKSPGPSRGSSEIHLLTIAAEAGDSARDILADIRSKRGRVASWRNGRALDLRSGGRGFDSRVGAQLRYDRGQVAHTRLPRRRQSSLL